MNPEVVVLGDVNVDIIAGVESYPQPGGDVQPLATELCLGGTSLNTAIVLTRLGISVLLVGRVGRDVLGDWAIAEMERQGLSAQAIQRDDEMMTGLVYIAVTPNGQRTMFGGGGANRNLANGEVLRDALQRARWLHTTSYNVLGARACETTLEALRAAREVGAATSLDVGDAPLRLAPALLAAIAQTVDVLLPSENTAIERHDGQSSVRKLGEAGCEIAYAGGKGTARVPAFRVHAVDTTGAGDAFNGGLIAGRVRRLDWLESMILANACGAAAATVHGAGSAFPSLDFVLSLLRDQAPDGWREAARRVIHMFQME